MFWLALVAATAVQADVPKREAVPLRQARASVRLVRASPIHFEQIERQSPGALRKSVIRSPDGAVQEARLIEFE